MNTVPNGIIQPGDVNPYGFTAEHFEGWLWQFDDAVMISFIVSKQPGQGHFRRLVETILAHGYSVKVPTPFADMRWMLEKNGFVHTQEHDKLMGIVDVWVKHPQEEQKSDE